jgi:putative flippase GtrA
VFFWLLYSRAGAPYLLAQALATAMVFGLNFETNRRYTFKSA